MASIKYIFFYLLLEQTQWKTAEAQRRERDGGLAGRRRMPDGEPLLLKDGGGSEAGVSPVTTSWVTEHDLLHLDPISQFLTTS